MNLRLFVGFQCAPSIVLASTPMKLFRLFSSLFLMTVSAAALAQARLDVRIKPANPDLKTNVEGM
ncbi:hypothetical protein PSA5_08800 [Pseudomonas syringae pv. actinidiae]|nr:hypothetical protein PSA5_08800 [Pseudomonas syringae pv. actinidiae]